MIRYVKHQNINTEKWDLCIHNSVNSLVYAYSWYLDTLCEKWDALVEDDYQIVFPLPYRIKMGIKYAYQPFFTQQLGIFSQSILSQEKTEEFLRNIPDDYKFAEINLNSLNKLNPKEFSFIPQKNHLLDLIGTYDTIKKGYSKNALRNINKAEKGQLSILRNCKPEEVIRLFRENRGRNIYTLKTNDYKRLNKLIHLFIYKGVADILCAYTERNEICAAAVFLRSNKRSIFFFSGMNNEGRDEKAMFYLIDNYIREQAGKVVTLDFEGSNNENLARFYKSFGAKETYYPLYYLNRINPLLYVGIRAIKGLRKLIFKN